MNTHVLSAEEKLVRVTAQEKEYRTAKLDASQLERLYEASLLKQDELTLEGISQYMVPVEEERKLDTLCYLY